ncbi:MAG: hypothetical protein ACTSRH_18635 [Promethearchaeota archaeon]
MVEVNFKVNDKELPLNKFMQILFANIVDGYLKSAKEVPENIKIVKIKINY